MKKRKNKYPLNERTVVYSRKKRLQPIPMVGKKYHCFDDGKITFSRHYIIKVDEVLGFMAFKKKYREWFDQYTNTAKSHYWLYSRRTDKFVIAHNGENNEFGVYVRTKQGGWFGIGNYWNCGTLDISGDIWKELVNDIDEFDYTDEEKKKLIEEGNI